MFDTVKFGKTIKTLRHLKGFTTYQLANELHISDYYLIMLESGRATPSIALFVYIINYFGMTSNDYSNFNIVLDTNNILQETAISLSNEEYKFLYDTILDYIYSKKERIKNV